MNLYSELIIKDVLMDKRYWTSEQVYLWLQKLTSTYTAGTGTIRYYSKSEITKRFHNETLMDLIYDEIESREYQENTNLKS